jgi:hypothetical protein
MPEKVSLIGSIDVAKQHVVEPVTRKFLDVYADLVPTGATRLPMRAQMAPEHLVQCLPYMAIMDCGDLEAPFYRLAGTIYSQYFGTNPTGRNYLSYVPEHRHAAVKESFGTCLHQPGGMLMKILGASAEGHERTTETLGLPVADDATGLARFIYLTTVALEDVGWTDDATLFTKRIDVLERRFLDIGFGTPATYLGVELSLVDA